MFRRESRGVNPSGIFVDGAGNIFGATLGGGGFTSEGTVFELTPKGAGYAFKSIYDFYGSNGESPNPPIEDSNGNLFLTTQRGGAYGAGTALELSPTAKGYVQSAFYSFGSAGDGAVPEAQFTLVGDTLYTTTVYGGKHDLGTIVAMSGRDLSEKGRYSFAWEVDGQSSTTLASDASGNLYGTASGGPDGEGYVYAFPATGKAPNPSILYSFSTQSLVWSPAGDVALDSNGNVYGEATATQNIDDNCGAVFALTRTSGTYTLSALHAFTGGADGCFPVGGVTASGNTLVGSTFSAGEYGAGTIFSLSTDGSGYTVIHALTGKTGSQVSDLVPASDAIYGTDLEGGQSESGQPGGGVVFRMTTR
jgi:uncharacterized repeat protein (TIGR03803 family)